jgi:hypothetical protein
MPGISISADVDFPRYIGSELPSPDGLLAFHYLYGSQAAAVINQADPDGTPATVTGVPTFDADSGTFSQSKYFELANTASRLSQTLMAVYKKPAIAGSAMAIANYEATQGESLFYDPGSGGSLRANYPGNNFTATGLSAAVGTDFFVHIATWSEGSSKQYGYHAGIFYGPFSGTGDRSPLSTNNMRIGRGFTAVTTQEFEMMFAAMWDVEKDSTQALEIAEWCAAAALALGVSDLSS